MTLENAVATNVWSLSICPVWPVQPVSSFKKWNTWVLRTGSGQNHGSELLSSPTPVGQIMEFGLTVCARLGPFQNQFFSAGQNRQMESYLGNHFKIQGGPKSSEKFIMLNIFLKQWARPAILMFGHLDYWDQSPFSDRRSNWPHYAQGIFVCHIEF